MSRRFAHLQVSAGNSSTKGAVNLPSEFDMEDASATSPWHHPFILIQMDPIDIGDV
jgi:hypothetical protein